MYVCTGISDADGLFPEGYVFYYLSTIDCQRENETEKDRRASQTRASDRLKSGEIQLKHLKV